MRMLTPDQLRDIRFERNEDGFYPADAVDQALDQIQEDYAEIFAENGNMIRKISVLAAKIEEYRKDENVLRDVLYNAQKSADLIVAAANDRAAEIENGARDKVHLIEAQANGIIDDAKLKAEKINAAAEAEYTSIISSAKVLSDGYLNAARESADAVTKETEKTVNELLEGCDTKATAMLENAQTKSASLLEDANTAAEAIIVNAQGEAEDIIKAAEQKVQAHVEELTRSAAEKESAANTILEEAKAEAQRMTDEAQQKAALLEAETAEKAQQRLASAEAESARMITEAQTESDRLLNDAKEQSERLRIDVRTETDTLRRETDATVSGALGEAEHRAYEMLDIAKTTSARVMDEARENSETLLTTARAEADSVVENANKSSFLKYEEAKRRSDDVVEETRQKAIREYEAKILEAKTIYEDAGRIYDERLASAETDAAALIERAKERAQEIISNAETIAERLRTENQEKVSQALAYADSAVERKLNETKEKCAEILALSRNEADARVNRAESASNEYFRQSQAKAAALLIAANTECERILTLVKKEIPHDSPIAYSLRMPQNVQPLDDAKQAQDLLQQVGINSVLHLEKPEIGPDPAEIATASVAPTVGRDIEAVHAMETERAEIAGYSAVDFIEENHARRLAVTPVLQQEDAQFTGFDGLTDGIKNSFVPLEVKSDFTTEDVGAAVTAAKDGAEKQTVQAKEEITRIKNLPFAEELVPAQPETVIEEPVLQAAPEAQRETQTAAAEEAQELLREKAESSIRADAVSAPESLYKDIPAPEVDSFDDFEDIDFDDLNDGSEIEPEVPSLVHDPIENPREAEAVKTEPEAAAAALQELSEPDAEADFDEFSDFDDFESFGDSPSADSFEEDDVSKSIMSKLAEIRENPGDDAADVKAPEAVSAPETAPDSALPAEPVSEPAEPQTVESAPATASDGFEDFGDDAGFDEIGSEPSAVTQKDDGFDIDFSVFEKEQPVRHAPLSGKKKGKNKKRRK